MKNELKNHISNLEKKGITFLKNIFSKSECNKFMKRFEKLAFEFEKKKKKLGNQGQTIQNYFAYDQKLLKFFSIKKVDKILKQVIDDDYVLINSSLTNRFNRNENLKKKESDYNDLGGKWHHD